MIIIDKILLGLTITLILLKESWCLLIDKLLVWQKHVQIKLNIVYYLLLMTIRIIIEVIIIDKDCKIIRLKIKSCLKEYIWWHNIFK